jgi:hypothetical protein
MPDSYKNVTGDLGVDLFRDSRMIDDRELVRAKNLVPIRPTLYGKRKTAAFGAYVTIGNLYYTYYTIAADVPVALCFFETPNAITGLAVHQSNSQLVCTAIPGGTATPQQPLAVAGWYASQPVFAPFKDRIYIFPGKPTGWRNTHFTSPVFYYDVNAQTFTGYTWAPSLPGFQPLGGVRYLRRMVYWNLADDYEDCLAMSDDDDPATISTPGTLSTFFSSPGRWFRIGSKTGGAIMSCVPVMLTEVGTPGEGGLLVLKENSCHLVTGELNQTTDTTSSIGTTRVNDMNVKAGCVSEKTVVRTPHGVIWCGPDDVWVFSEGQTPRPIGTKIRERLKAQPADFRWKLHAVHFDGYYRLALFKEGSSGGWLTAPEEQWWLDLREGAPPNAAAARWYGPQEYLLPTAHDTVPTPGTHCMAVDERSGVAAQLYTLVNVSTAVGACLTMVDLEGQTGLDQCMRAADFPLWHQIGNAPTTELWSKDYDFDDFFIDKVYTGTELAVRTSALTEFTVDAVITGGDFEAQASNALISGGFDLDVDTLDQTLLAETFDHALIYPDETTRPLGKSIQLRISDNVGYVINADNDRIVFDMYGGTTLGLTAILTRGLYADLEALLDELVDQMQTVAAAAGLTTAFEHWNTAQGAQQYTRIREANGGTFRFRVDTDSETAILAAMIGYDVSAAMAYNNPQLATTEVHWAPGNDFELGGVRLRVNPIPRRLS